MYKYDPLVTMVGTLPPVKGISDTCIELLRELDRLQSVYFLNFSKIYPPFLYPGGSPTNVTGKVFRRPPLGRSVVDDALNWYNPLGWAWAGLRIRSPIVHIHWWTSVLIGPLLTIALIAKLRGRRIVVTVHNIIGHESGRVDRAAATLVLQLADVAIVPTEASRAALEKFLGQRTPPTKVIPLGIPSFYETSPTDRSGARQALGLSDEEFVILMFGNIRPYKGLSVLLQAFRQVVDDVRSARVKLVIAGSSWGSFEQYGRLLNELNLHEFVRTDIGYVHPDRVQDYFAAADLVTLPYLEFDGQSGPGRIAIVFGKPLVVTNVGGLPELVGDERAIVPPNAPAPLARAILRVIEDGYFRRRLEEQVRALAPALAWSASAKAVTEVYQELLGSRG